MLKITTVVAVVFSLVACEDDFETIGSRVIGEPGFNADLYDDADNFCAVHMILLLYKPIIFQLNFLGVYDDPVFGKQNSQYSFHGWPCHSQILLLEQSRYLTVWC